MYNTGKHLYLRAQFKSIRAIEFRPEIARLEPRYTLPSTFDGTLTVSGACQGWMDVMTSVAWLKFVMLILSLKIEERA